MREKQSRVRQAGREAPAHAAGHSAPQPSGPTCPPSSRRSQPKPSGSKFPELGGEPRSSAPRPFWGSMASPGRQIQPTPRCSPTLASLFLCPPPEHQPLARSPLHTLCPASSPRALAHPVQGLPQRFHGGTQTNAQLTEGSWQVAWASPLPCHSSPGNHPTSPSICTHCPAGRRTLQGWPGLPYSTSLLCTAEHLVKRHRALGSVTRTKLGTPLRTG